MAFIIYSLTHRTNNS